VNPMTTLLASGWGLLSAQLLFTTHLSPLGFNTKFLFSFAALLPLIAVWATIERKRWGRLALVGLSTTAIVLFVVAIAVYAGSHSQDPSLPGWLPREVQKLPFFDSPFATGALMLLAAANSYWLRRPHVVAEFEQNKRPALAFAQRLIAASLVVCWCLTMIASIGLPNRSYGATVPRSHPSTTHLLESQRLNRPLAAKP